MSSDSTMFCLAADLRAGYTGGFIEGPARSFDLDWLRGPEIPFMVSQGGQPRLASALIQQHIAQMGKDLYLALSDAALAMMHEAARGRDCTPGFDEQLAALNDILDRSPWTLHPDYGCVRHVDVVALDEATLSNPAP